MMKGTQSPAGDTMMWLDPRRVTVGGELGRRITITVQSNILALDIERDFLAPFRGGAYTGLNDGSGGFVGIGNLIDSSARLAAHTGDAALVACKTRLVAEILATQKPDGYIGWLPPEKRTWSLWDLHEQGYIINGLVTDCRLFGQERSLAAARRLADYIAGRWATKPVDWEKGLPCAESVGLTGLARAFLALHAATGDRRYLDFCSGQLGTGSWNMPIVLGRRPPILGHVYSYFSHCLAQHELYRLQPREALMEPTRRAIDFLTAKDGMLITGAVGQEECWTDDQVGRGKLGETCATLYQLFAYDSLLRLDGTSGWGDLMERTIYNAAFGAQSPDGRRLRYYVPFEGDRVYFPHDTYCCPNNYRRIIALLPRLICYRTTDGIAVNLYSTSEATVDAVAGAEVTVRQQTDYPREGSVRIGIEPSRPSSFTLSLRIPRWCSAATASVNGRPVDAPVSPGRFLRIEREWRRGDTVALELPMEWRLVKGRKSQSGRAAVMRGPVIYTLNPSLNPGLASAPAADLADLVLLATPRGPVEEDATVRPGGTSCTVRADRGRPGNGALSLRLTEFPDPDGKWTYFRLKPGTEGVEDELLRGG
jgi:DUF1680 family protein